MIEHKLLADLNIAQKQAVLVMPKTLQIVAGAGTGKTKVLTRKMSYLIEVEQVNPFKILAVTFTNKAAKEMRERASAHINENTKNLQIYTFYNLCNLILKEDIHHLGYSKTFSILDVKDIDNILSLLYAKHDLDNLDLAYRTMRAYFKKRKLSDFVTNWEIFDRKEIDEDIMEKMDLVYQSYIEYTKENNFVDFEDLLLLVNHLFETNPKVRKKWESKFEYVLVDEFQDTSPLQYEILKVIAKNAYLTIVGDPDQTIFWWHGADINIFLNFEKDFPESMKIKLEQNYRSTKKILDAANKLIAKNKRRLTKNLFTEKEEGEAIEFNHAFNIDAEARWVVTKINMLKKQKVQLKNIVILYRSSHVSRALEQQLVKENINHQIVNGTKFFEKKEIKNLIYFLKTIYSANTLAFYNTLLFFVRSLAKKDLDEVLHQAAAAKLSLYKYIITRIKTENLGLSAKTRKETISLLKTIVKFKKLLKNEKHEANYSWIFDAFLKEVKFYDLINYDRDDENAIQDNVYEFLTLLQKWQEENPSSELSKFFEDIALYSNRIDESAGNNFISLMTIHNAKGLEFDYVFIIGLNENILPSAKALYSKDGSINYDKLEEERRIAYVALTRAKTKVFISDARGIDPYSKEPKKTSRFLTEMGISLEDHVQEINSITNITQEIQSGHHSLIVGDFISHSSFGEGELLEIQDNDFESSIVVRFKNKAMGIRTISKTHESIRKILK
ncbi:ATP-dependent helicase [Mycoplasmopsis pulmonis]|uniref:ATP-dependent helicase n=1 Tax=Mycoplasmopsis pulmonis TaxID=2107 RepID=UPI002ACEBA03|nr:ATP-dependent helicase [Mycoplasmopsis pulmonis]MDZ7293389.1 ATP-dependent helicase [Mycoplasmopsis pulmonis]